MQSHLRSRARNSTRNLIREIPLSIRRAFRKRAIAENPATLSMLLVPLRRTLPKANAPRKLLRKHTANKLVRHTHPDFRAVGKGIADADLAAIADAQDMIGRTTDANAKELGIRSKPDGRLASNRCRENLLPK
jgi:hypothetical protein